jgi:hypothetical protein
MNPDSTHRRVDWLFVGATTLAALGLLWLLIAMPILDGTPNWAEDFLAYQSASHRLVEAGTLYSELSLQGAFEPMAQDLYLYPPPLGITMGLLARMPGQEGAGAWYLLHIVVLALACALMPVRRRTKLLTFGVAALSFGVLRDVTMGNVSVLLLLPLALGWRWLDRPAGSLALAIAASVRVTFGVFLLWFLVRRAWRPFLWMAMGGLALIVLSLPFVGIDGYRDYLTVLRNVSGTADLVQNRHLTFTALWLGMPVELAWLVLVPVYVLAMVAVVMSRRRDPEVGFMVTTGAALLLAPLIWDHYLSLVLLPAAFLAERGRPWALLLPLTTWLPAELLPFVSIAAMLLPFMARGKASPVDDQPPDEPSPADVAATSERRVTLAARAPR